MTKPNNMNPTTLPRRTVGEWTIRSQHVYSEPFADVAVDAVFTAPSGQTLTVPAFYDGDNTWRVRFNPGEAGAWSMRTVAVPADPDLAIERFFEVTEHAAHGFLQATPGQAWGFAYESGEPAFILGDTTYNLFGAAHCDLDAGGFMRRRSQQGFNLLHVARAGQPLPPTRRLQRLADPAHLGVGRQRTVAPLRPF